MMRIVATEVIDVQGHISVIHKALKKFNEKIDIKLAYLCAGERHVKLHTRATTAVQDHPRQRLVQGNIGMPITHDAFFIANRLAEGLPQCDADVLHRVVRIDVQITLGHDIQIHLPVARDLIQHMLEKRQPRIERALTGTIKT